MHGDIRKPQHAVLPIGLLSGVGPRITQADDAFLAMVGYPRSDLDAGLVDYVALTPPEYRHLDLAGARQAAAGGFNVPYQKQLIRKDGSRVSVLLTGTWTSHHHEEWQLCVVQLSPFVETPLDVSSVRPADTVVGVLPAVRAADQAHPPAQVTEERQGALVESMLTELVGERSRLLAMLNNTDALIWSVDSDLRLFGANRAFEAAFRITTGRDIDVGDFVLGPELSDDLLVHWRAWYARVLNGERLLSTLRSQVGGVIYHSEHRLAPMFDESGCIIGATGLSQDITDRVLAEAAVRASEIRFRSIAAASPYGIFLTDPNGRCVYANARLSEIWGVPEDELLDDGYVRCMHPDDRERVLTTCRTSMQAGLGFTVEYRVVRLDGAERYVRVQTTPIRDGDTVTGFSGTADDDTERRELERTDRQRARMESLGTLAGGVAHDFNNLLGIVLGHTELALGEPELAPRVNEHLTEIRTASSRARDLVQQILSFSRQVERTAQPVDLRELVIESARLLRAAFPVSVDLDVSITDTPVVVLGDASALQQIVMNLCTNAEHAMRAQGGGHLTLALTTDTSAPVSTAMLVVTDTGHGMTAEVRGRALDPFFTTKPIGEGTGMGLSVVHGVVTSLGGTLSIESAVGVGTTCRVTLPMLLGVVLSPSHPATIAPTPAVTMHPASTRNARVLLVEDEPALARFAERALQRAGYIVTTMYNGADALAAMKQTPDDFDVVVSDLTMPGLSGDRLALAVKAARAQLPVILMTGFSTVISSRNAQAHGIDAVLDKPFSAQALVETVTRVLPPTLRR